MGIRSICILTCLSCISLFLNNSASKEASSVGSVNGLGMTFSGFFRALGPTVGGAIFAWSITIGQRFGFPLDVNLVFLMFGVVFFVGNVMCSLLPDHLNHKYTAVSGDAATTSCCPANQFEDKDKQTPLLSLKSNC